ncbi:MAG: hypothetical protein OXH33_04635 [bacterium]|nr:hypothetical protein [bacterium]
MATTQTFICFEQAASRTDRRKNRRGYLVALLASVLLLSACEVRLHANLEIEEDESGTIAVVMAFDDALASMAGPELGDGLGEMSAQLPSEWQAEPFAEDGFNGIRITVPFESLTELQDALTALTQGESGSDLPVGELMGFLGDIIPTREGDTFRFSLTMPAGMDQALGEELGPMPIEASMLDSVFDIRMSLTLPGEIVSHNADIKVGDTLVWNLSFADSVRTLQAESMLTSAISGALILVALALAVLVALVVVLLVRNRRMRPMAHSEQVPEEG